MSDDPSGYPGAPPDWYPDPAGGPGRRWWDGYAWTDAVVLPEQPPQAPERAGTPSSGYGVPGHEMRGYGTAGYGTPWYSTAPVGNASGLLNHELRIARLARTAMVVIGLYYLWQYVNLRTQAPLYRSIGHQYHLIEIAAQHHQTAPQFTIPNQANGGVLALGAVLGLATVAAVVIACTWQYRAATTARALGYAATHAPGWGVGSWFVPIVNFWMPYQALRDCLAPEDPNRQLVRFFWVCVIGQEVFGLTAVVTALFSSSLSLVFCVPGALLALGIVSTAPRLVIAVAADHGAAVARLRQ